MEMPTSALTGVTLKDMFDAGLHFGHQTKRWNPKMKGYIFDKRNGIHIIDLQQSVQLLDEAAAFVRDTILEGKKILFVATKKQVAELVKTTAESTDQYYVTERWLGGTLTNAKTLRSSVKRMRQLQATAKANGGELSEHKQENSMLRRELAKLEKNLTGVAEMAKQPGAVVIIDCVKEANAVKEAVRLHIPVVAVVDTNADPEPIDYVIPGNDDSVRGVELILNGLAKKLILSDYLAVNHCDRVFENPLLYSGFENLLALFGYSLQVYADFSGYTDIAIGVAMLMGFYLPKNFNSPYKARNASEFWKRWHISLSKWLQDYLYIPLGGNRKGTFWSYAIILGIGFLASALARNWWVFGTVLALTAILAVLITFCKGLRKELIADINRMDTMLLGGLWHGASWNFMIWGGLNGLGMLIYRFWHSCNVYFRTLTVSLVCLAFYLLNRFFPAAVFNLFFIWTAIIAFGAWVHMLYHKCHFKAAFRWLDTAWSVLMTFIFITFTRLFFRSGSNLEPALANEQAWNTAKNMVERIGGPWDMSLVPQMAWHHRNVIFVFVAGMIIHWLPERFKRRYRLWFATMPLPLMVLVCVLAVFLIFQFVVADLQSFIYFQF